MKKQTEAALSKHLFCLYDTKFSANSSLLMLQASLVIQKRVRGIPKKNWMEGIRKAMNERNLNEGQWEDRNQWSLGVGQRRKTF